MALFGRKSDEDPFRAPMQDVKWVKSPSGKYYRLFDVDVDETGLMGTPGVFVIWHGGLKPEWVYIGSGDSLGQCLYDAIDNPDVMEYRSRGGLIVTWSPIKQEFHSGVVHYLTVILEPLASNAAAPPEGTKPIPVYAPGFAPDEVEKK